MPKWPELYTVANAECNQFCHPMQGYAATQCEVMLPSSATDVTLHSNPGICSVRVFCGIQIPELVEMFVLKSRTETDARKKVSVIFVLISRTNFSRNFGVHPSVETVEIGTD
jgi:hypothetical protein